MADYEAFVGGVMNKRNQGRQKRLEEEIAKMRPLRAKLLKPYQEVRVKVNKGSMVRVQNNVYSVPTHLIGQEVRVRIYEWHLEIYYRQIQVEWMPRLVGQKKQLINYRHLIDSLLRKPGGFRNYRYREALFPSLVFRQAWERLQEWHSPRKADLIYLRILRLAARTLECEVVEALTLLLTQSARWDERDVEGLLNLQPSISIPALNPLIINLSQYDHLLEEVYSEPA